MTLFLKINLLRRYLAIFYATIMLSYKFSGKRPYINGRFSLFINSSLFKIVV